jgi:hypothetical protein
MRVAGVNLLAVLAGAVVFYMVGFVFYGVLFTEVWSNETLRNHGLLGHDAPPLDAATAAATVMQIPGAMGPGMAYGLGFVLTLITTFGIAFVITKTKAASLPAALGRAFVLWLCFGAMTLGYNVLYSTESKVIFGIDLLHLFLGYHLAAAAIFLVDAKALKAPAA